MGNDYTKSQIKDFIESAIERSKRPDPVEMRKRLKKKRLEKKTTVSKRYGF